MQRAYATQKQKTREPSVEVFWVRVIRQFRHNQSYLPTLTEKSGMCVKSESMVESVVLSKWPRTHAKNGVWLCRCTSYKIVAEQEKEIYIAQKKKKRLNLIFF